MAREKFQIIKMEDTRTREFTFKKRHQGLFKKARELSILCDADVAIIIYSSSGRLYEYSSSDITNILTRFNKCVESKQGRVVVRKAEDQMQKSNEAGVLKNNENIKRRKFLGKDINNMSLQELLALDKKLDEGVMFLMKRKEEMLKQQVEQSKMEEQQVMRENEILRRQVKVTQPVFQPTNYLATLATNYAPETTLCFWPPVHHDPDTALHLGPPSSIIEEDGNANNTEV